MARTLRKTATTRKSARLRKNAGPRGAETTPDYAAHFHEAPSGYLILSPDGAILDVNETFAGWTGHRREKLLGGNVAELMPRAVQVVFASYVVPQLAVAGSVNELVADLLCKDGEYLSVLLSAVRSTRPDGGTIDRVTVVKASARRIRERELVDALEKAEAAEAARAEVEAELREKQRALGAKNRLLQEGLAEKTTENALLETVLNAADTGLLAVDAQGNAVLSNDYLSSIWPSAAGVPLGHKPDQVLAADRVTPLPKAESPVLRASSGKAFTDQQLWLGTGDNQIAVSVSASPIKANGAFSGSVLAVHEVTRLARAVAAQEEFAANLSHELRTPLTSIMGYLDLVLEDSRLAPHLRGALDVAVRNSERLFATVSGMVAVPSETSKPQRRPVNLADAVRAGITSARSKNRQVDFLTDVPVSTVVDVDPQKLSQVVGNLLVSAVQASPAGGTVYVHLWQQGQTVCLRIADTGMGSGEAEQEKAAPKFARSRRALASVTPGAGLAEAKSIIEEHGGDLTFVNNPGEGTVYRVNLPVSAEIAALNR
ncbi:PAS domain S-box protein [Arthrobacter sp. zg-Y40]|uniref:sensor histidine kinase n=1 Tax=Arthrobacter sp. zg-Y40 TaxID=2886939 RepID=UPI001D14C9A1|nr:PAS domain S-box protein [Arthrobacter sp. zg-Y40]